MYLIVLVEDCNPSDVIAYCLSQSVCPSVCQRLRLMVCVRNAIMRQAVTSLLYPTNSRDVTVTSLASSISAAEAAAAIADFIKYIMAAKQ